MKIQQLSAAYALASLNSSRDGLSLGEASHRLREYGPNRVEEVIRESTLIRFLKEFTHFFALILWLPAALAFFAERLDPGQGMAKIGYAVVAVIVLVGASPSGRNSASSGLSLRSASSCRDRWKCCAMARCSGSLRTSSYRAT